VREISFQTDVLPLKDELFRLALRITLNRSDAEDVVQETMLKVWSQRDRWERIESMEAFCLTICRNLSLDRIKLADSQVTSLEGAPEAADTNYASNPEEQAVQRDRVSLVRRIISQLPEKQRSVMQLRDIEGKSYRDIAHVMNISEDQVKVCIFRARQAVKKAFIRNEKYGL